MKILKVKDLKKIYGKYENEVRALDGIDLDIEPHKFTAIVVQVVLVKVHYFTVLQA